MAELLEDTTVCEPMELVAKGLLNCSCCPMVAMFWEFTESSNWAADVSGCLRYEIESLNQVIMGIIMFCIITHPCFPREGLRLRLIQGCSASLNRWGRRRLETKPRPGRYCYLHIPLSSKTCSVTSQSFPLPNSKWRDFRPNSRHRRHYRQY